ncbi:MAG: hypothetical protein EOO38_04035, partial [Cytophagaceae bacterium]
MGTLITAAAVWETVAPMVMENAKDALKSKWSKFKWTESNNKYKRHLTDHYSTTKLLGNPKPIRIKQIYTDVYVLDQLTAYRRLSIDEKGQLKEMTGLPISVKRIPLLDIVRDKSRVYILGKPGAGKSTFLKNLPNESPLILNGVYALAARYSKHPSIRTNPSALYNSGDVFYI